MSDSVQADLVIFLGLVARQSSPFCTRHHIRSRIMYFSTRKGPLNTSLLFYEARKGTLGDRYNSEIHSKKDKIKNRPLLIASSFR